MGEDNCDRRKLHNVFPVKSAQLEKYYEGHAIKMFRTRQVIPPFVATCLPSMMRMYMHPRYVLSEDSVVTFSTRAVISSPVGKAVPACKARKGLADRSTHKQEEE